MFRSRLLGVILAGGLALQLGAQEVIVRTAPPRAIVETRGARPSRDHVWISGYHNWNGTAYAWAPGRWEVPPRPGQRWEAHRWVKRNGGYVMVEGRWR
jgi:WXXGXW repeat (2 copies)